MADVFISYAREDKARADQVAQALEQVGFDVFWDSAIPPGQTWSDFIEGKLGVCKAVIVLWSETSTKSQWVREEARMGRDRGKLIPARIDSAIAPFGFGEVQTADLSTWTGETETPEWRRFVEAVRSAVSRASTEPPRAQTFAAQPQPQPQAAAAPAVGVSGGSGQVQLIYILYLASLVIGVTAIFGVIMSYVAKDNDPDWLKSHHIFIIHTFWIGLLYGFVGFVTMFIGIGVLVLLFLLVWWIVRCVQGLDYLSKSQPIPAPRSWLFAK